MGGDHPHGRRDFLDERRVEPRVDGHLNTSAQGEGRVEDALEVGKGHGSLPLIVHIETQLAPVQVQKDADNGPGHDPALTSLGMFVVVQEPASLGVNVHAPALLILPYIVVNVKIH